MPDEKKKYGVFYDGVLIQKFETEREANAYLKKEMKGDGDVWRLSK